MAGPVLTAAGLGDLVQTTLRDLGRGRFTDISSSLQEHTAMGELFKANRVEITSGYGLQWDVMVGQTGAAQNVGLAAQDVVNVVDVMTQATADWRNTTTNFAIEMREIAMNREPARIVELIKTRRLAAQISLAELMEANWWGPPVGATDNLTPWGVNTWIVKNATEGFNGGAPTGYSVIGLNPTTYPNWKNWTAPYTTVSRDDFIRKARKAATYIKFMPTVDGIPTFNTGNNWGWYTNYSVISPLEETLASQNDNLGSDIASQDGKTMFRRAPVKWVPYLDADTTNPFYGIQWGEFKTMILSGIWGKETVIPNYPGQHTMAATFMDYTYQIVARNRRCHAVLSNGTTYPS